MSSFIDSGAGLVLSTYVVHFSPSIEQRKQFVTRSDKIGLIAEKYTCSYYGKYHLIFKRYLNSVCFIKFLRIFCINIEVLIKMLCSQK